MQLVKKVTRTRTGARPQQQILVAPSSESLQEMTLFVCCNPMVPEDCLGLAC